ncbi:MAG: His-Xaa-Ser system radical SAM maturase HxsB [Colwellia sp.]|jgi:Arylsulfatase regulator (Fe-S oxidoreductase)
MTYSLLPFNFERINNVTTLISNTSGSYHFIDDIETLIESPEKLPHKTLNELTSKGFISSSKEQSISFQKLHASALSKRISEALSRPYLFMIIPTLRCDHKCNYCQVSRVSENKSGYDLPMDSIDNSIKTIRKYGRAPFKIEFQGGEPLLRMDFIMEFITKWEELYPNEKVDFVIATSLSLLTIDFANWCKDRPVSFSLSLDGTKSSHDSNRILTSNSSHDLLIRNLETLKNTGGLDKLGFVSTITKSAINNPEDIILAHIDLGINDMFVRPLSPFGLANKSYSSGYTVEEFEKYYEKLLKLLLNEYKDHGLREFHTAVIVEKIIKNRSGRYVDLKTPSGHIMGALIINYNGEVYGSDESRMIDKLYNMKELSLGNIEDDINIHTSQNIHLLSESFIHVQPGCEECAYLPYCGSDLMHHLSTQADPIGDKSISRFCAYQKAMFRTIFKLLSNKEHKEKLLSWI